jgi:mono/diheme cytochrome c family protein
MRDPDVEIGAFDLRQFPRDQHDRFVNSVTYGKDIMPSWGNELKPADIEALWAYVCTEER